MRVGSCSWSTCNTSSAARRGTESGERSPESAHLRCTLYAVHPTKLRCRCTTPRTIKAAALPAPPLIASHYIPLVGRSVRAPRIALTQKAGRTRPARARQNSPQIGGCRRKPPRSLLAAPIRFGTRPRGR
eukprot:1233443-Prymnesium_polylepis.1